MLVVKAHGVCCMVGRGEESWVRKAGGMYVFVQHWRTKEYTSPCVCGYLSLLLPGKFHSIPKLNNMTLFMKRLVNNIPPSLRAHSYNVGNALICLQGRDLQLGQATIVVMLSSLTTRPTGCQPWGISHEIRAPQVPVVMLYILEHAVLLFTHLIPRAFLSLGEGNGNPFQYSCLENPMDGGAW